MLIYALFKSHAIDEVEECVGRYREAAKVVSDSKGGFCLEELNFLFYSARLHEVSAVHLPPPRRWKPLCMHVAWRVLPARPQSVCLSHVPPVKSRPSCEEVDPVAREDTRSC